MPILRTLLRGTDQVDAHKRSRLPRLSGSSTAAGLTVDAERALQVSAVYACVRLISGAIAQLPVHVYRRVGDGRRPVGGHPLLPLLADRPNPEIDAGEFWRAMVGWMLLRGNAFAVRERGGGGQTVGLWPVAPTSVNLKRGVRGDLGYEVTLSDVEFVPGFRPGVAQVVPASRLLHFRAFGLGLWGLSPVGLARTKVATGYAAEQYGAGFFARGAQPGGVLSTDQSLSDEQFDRLNEQWADRHGGFGRSYTPAVLEGGLHWENVGLPPGDAQFLETQRYSSAAIAGHIYGVPPHMIGDVDRSTSWGSGIAEQGIGFVRYTLMDWITRLERVTRQLFLDSDEYVKFATAGLERGDLKGRYDAYAVGKQWGWLSTNDIRRLEDEQPVDGGDVYLQPLNMVPAGTFDEPADAPRSEGGGVRKKLSMRDRHVRAHEKALRKFFTDQADDVLAAHGVDRDFDRPASDKKLGRLLASLGLAAAVEAGRQVADQLDIELDTAGFAGWTGASGRAAAERINDATFEQVADAADEDELRGVFDSLVKVAAARIAVTRVAESFGFGRHDAAKQAGASTKTWVTTSAAPRASHAALNGETVPLNGVFSNGGRWPGDTAKLPAGEVAGCTCEMTINK